MPANNVTPSKSPETDEEFRAGNRAGEGTRTRLCKRDVMGGLAGLQGRERGDQSAGVLQSMGSQRVGHD